MSPQMETGRCETCRETMAVRTADRKRGWGRFCSKSCKAKKQTRERRREFPAMSQGGYDWTEGGER